VSCGSARTHFRDDRSTAGPPGRSPRPLAPVLHVVAGGWQRDGEGPTAGRSPRSSRGVGGMWRTPPRVGRDRGVFGCWLAHPAHPASPAPCSPSPSCCRGAATTWRGPDSRRFSTLLPGGGRNVENAPAFGFVIAGGMRGCSLPRPVAPGRPARPRRPVPGRRARAPAPRRGRCRSGVRPAAHLGIRPRRAPLRQPPLQVVAGGWQQLGEGLTALPRRERARARKRGGAAIAAPPPVRRPSRVSPAPPGAGEIGGCSGVTP